MKVLVLDSGVTSSYHVMRSLAGQGHEPHLASAERSIFFASKYCARALRSPSADDASAFGRFLVEIVRWGGYGLLICCGDDEAEVVWDRRHELEPFVHCLLPAEKWKDVAFQKHEANRHVERLGVAIPATVYPENAGDIEEVERTFKYPVVVKASTGSAGRLVRFALGPEQLRRDLDEIGALDRGRVSVQEYVPGPGFVVHLLFENGRPLAICSHRKERELPVGGGVTSSATTVKHPELDRNAIRVLESMQWHGLAKLDFKLDDRDGRFKFIELDPRVSASIDITRAAGADQVAMAGEMAEGKQPAPRLDYRAGVRYHWFYPRDVIRLLLEPWRLPSSLLGTMRRDTHGDLDLRDWRCTLRALRLMLWHLKNQALTGAVWEQQRAHREIRRHLALRAAHV